MSETIAVCDSVTHSKGLSNACDRRATHVSEEPHRYCMVSIHLLVLTICSDCRQEILIASPKSQFRRPRKATRLSAERMSCTANTYLGQSQPVLLVD